MYIYVYICILDDERGDEEAVLRRVGTRVIKHREREKFAQAKLSLSCFCLGMLQN